jgi:cell division protein FtsI (penicillin-binding protein 3)
LDAAGVEPTDMVDCQGGAMTWNGRTLHDDHTDHFGVVTVQYALEHSSDVGAAKMALKLGNQKFYDYIKGFGFGDRSGIELPSETRGLLRAPKKWDGTSILSLAIGQEIGVTPVQLVTMVSTIANGGVYMPPHVLLQSTDEMKGDARLKPMAFRPVNQLPDKLPDGAHRVIKELTSAKMRAMMQGTVVEGTGRMAALNGYSAGGKTGTAQKVDPVTHTYSHTKLVASFAGFAPVSNPAISVAVVIDTPTVGTRYGAETSAPVFQQVAQEVLEYLGVPHDQPVKTKKEMLVASKEIRGDGPSENVGDLQGMFDEVNNLPADDPLRAAAKVPVGGNAGLVSGPVKSTVVGSALSSDALTKFEANRAKPEGVAVAEARAPVIAPQAQARGSGAVVVDPARRVAVPSFVGAGLRAAVEQAGNAGLRVEPVGSGLARDQVPVAGTMVPVGTEVVVRFSR